MNTNEKNKWIKWIMSVCIFAASVAVYLLAVNNFITNYDSGVMHRYVFVGVSLMFFASTALVPIARINEYIKPIHWKSKIWNRIWNILFFFGVALAAALMEEYLWNDNFFVLRWWVWGLNFALVALVTFAFVMWIPKIWVSYTLTMVVNLIYGLVNHYVRLFKGCPPMYNDIFAAKTATTVMGSYTYTIDRKVAYGTVLFLCVLAFMLVIPPSDIKVKIKKKSGKVAIWAARIVLPVVLMIGVYNVDFEQHFGLGIYAWRPLISFNNNGAPMTMLISYQYSKPEKPQGYSEVAAQRILNAYEQEETAAEASTQKPIIIAIMNESFSDLSVLGDFESDPYLANWYAEDSYVMRGYVYSSVYGGGTCNSEFEFLTGNSMANCRTGTYPYESYDLENTTSIVQYLSEVEGYDTVAFHPYGADNWNRPLVYEEFGFHTFLS